MLKTNVLLNIFVGKRDAFMFFRIIWWIEMSKEQCLFEIKIFCNIMNVFFDSKQM